MAAPLAPESPQPEGPETQQQRVGSGVGFPGALWQESRLPADRQQLSPTELASSRMFINAKELYICTSPYQKNAQQNLGSWWDTPEASQARSGLDDLLAAAPAPVWSVVQDLVHFVPAGASTTAVDAAGYRVGTVLCRRTAFTTGIAPLQHRDEWFELDTSQRPSALLMTHSFAGMPVPGATLTLRTLFMDDNLFEVAPEAMLREVFDARTPALSAQSVRCSSNDHFAPTTDVEIDGEALTTTQLAALSKSARRAVAAARRAQLLHTLRECLGAPHWTGGFLALRHFATELASSDACLWSEPLAALLLRARTGGAPCFQLAQALENWAGAHIQLSQYAEAVALMRVICEMHRQAAEEHGFWTFGENYHSPTMWFNLGNYETNLSKYAEAIASYRSGIAALDAACAWYKERDLQPDPMCVSLQIVLPSAIAVAAVRGKLPAEFDTLLLHLMFQKHAGFKAAVDAGEARDKLTIELGFPIDSSCAEQVTATMLPSGRVFVTTNSGPSGEWEIIEVSPDVALRMRSRPCNKPYWRDADPSRRDCCVPDMVAARCAGCGAPSGPSFKACAACRLVQYCGASRFYNHSSCPGAEFCMRTMCRQGLSGGALVGAQGGVQSCTQGEGRRSRSAWQTGPMTNVNALLSPPCARASCPHILGRPPFTAHRVRKVCVLCRRPKTPLRAWRARGSAPRRPTCRPAAGRVPRDAARRSGGTQRALESAA